MSRWARRFVLAIVFGVAGFDIVSGIRLLTVDEPWLLAGYATSWNALPATVRADGGVRAFVAGPYRRVGAFSLHTGVVTLVWAILARNDRRLLTVLLVVYTLSGVVMFSVDWAYTRGTGYIVLKQVIGTLWAMAVMAHLYSASAWRRRA